MENFKFIKGRDLNELQFDTIGELLLETGYYKEIAQGNKLNLPAKEFYQAQVLKPYENYTHVLINPDQQDEVVGFFIAATNQEIDAVGNSIPNWRRDDPLLAAELKKCADFYIHETQDSDFILYNVAISPAYRGKGIYKILHKKLMKLAKARESQRIVFTVLNSYPAVNVYKHYGAKILGGIESKYFNDILLKCVFDISS